MSAFRGKADIARKKDGAEKADAQDKAKTSAQDVVKEKTLKMGGCSSALGAAQSPRIGGDAFAVLGDHLGSRPTGHQRHTGSPRFTEFFADHPAGFSASRRSASGEFSQSQGDDAV